MREMRVMKSRNPAISIVVPVLNESGNVQPLAHEISAVLKGRIPYEIIFVDDCSADDTRAEIDGVIDNNPFVFVRWHELNRGQSAAVRTGVMASRAEVIVVLDGDGQNDPHDIPCLYGQLTAVPSLSLVIGERRQRQDSLLRRLSSRIANSVRSSLLGDAAKDTGCGIKVFYRDEFLNLPAFDHMHRFMPALIQRNGGKVCSVPVNHRARKNGTSKYGVNNRLWVGIVDMLGVMWLQKRRL
jgi:dolichol-phosphate mannosyltransferase